MNDTLFVRLADLSQQLEQTSKRLEMTALWPISCGLYRRRRLRRQCA